MPPLSHFTKDEIGELWARSAKEAQAKIDDLRRQVEAADGALVDAGIAPVGSLADRIARLASERDVHVRIQAGKLTDRW